MREAQEQRLHAEIQKAKAEGVDLEKITGNQISPYTGKNKGAVNPKTGEKISYDLD